MSPRLMIDRVSPAGCSAAEIFNAEMFDALSRYRMDYRRHRMGAARGAKGEITALAMGSTSLTGNKRSSMKVRR